MRIGYSVEGSTDRALLNGLKQRWCPHASMVEGHFRASTQLGQRRELRAICEELILKSVDIIIILVDANDASWRDVAKEVLAHIPEEALHLVVVGVPDRNVECWICHDPNYVASLCDVLPEILREPDPKIAFEQAMDIRHGDRKEEIIAELVRNAPIGKWLAHRSFSNFYEAIVDFSQRHSCTIRNERSA
jgi:hypothetical protein